MLACAIIIVPPNDPIIECSPTLAQSATDFESGQLKHMNCGSMQIFNDKLDNSISETHILIRLRYSHVFSNKSSKFHLW